MKIKNYDKEINTETMSECCGAPVAHEICSDCKEHSEGEEVADQDQLEDALKETRDKATALKKDIAEAKRNLTELEEELENLDATESELEQHLIA